LLNTNKINQLIELNNFVELQKYLEGMLLKDPNNQELLLYLANCFRSTGKFYDAKKTYEKIIELDNTNTAVMRVLIDFLDESELKKFQEKINQIELDKISNPIKIDLYFSLGILNEKIKNYEISAKYFAKANNLKRKINPFNFVELENHFINLMHVFENLSFDKINFKDQKKIIFIIGLPRSGTSLLEAILGANKNIYSAGEIPNLKKVIRDKFVTGGSLNNNKIIESIKTQDSEIYTKYVNDSNLINVKKHIITDKNTENFKFLGLINIFFKNAKIINISRDPFENFCALYKINFNSATLNWTNSRDEIVKYYKNYLKFINLWKRKNIDNMIDINFEKLLLKPKETIDTIVDFCELEKNFDYMNFYKLNSAQIKTASAYQARQSIQKKNVFKYKNFKNYLNFN